MLIRGLPFPDELYYLIEHDVWASFEADGSATVGITSMGIKLSGEIYMCRPKGTGAIIEQGKSIAVVELAKAIVSVKSAVSGEVIAINDALQDRPELVHQDPYGEGWIAKLKLTQPEQDKTQLVQGEAALRALDHHAWLNMQEGDASHE